MHLPDELQMAIDEIVSQTPTSALRKARESLSRTYKEGGNSRSIFSDEGQKLAYLGSRMPATYAAVYKVLQRLPCPVSHFLDLGAGPGTASWAAAELFPSLTQITCIERSSEAIELGQNLARFSSFPTVQKAEWLRGSLTENFAIPDADLAVLSYVLNELEKPEEVVQKCWERLPLLAIIEPGTPKGFQLIKSIRQKLIDWGAHIIAPCPHSFSCPNDWCHFSARIERSRLHRLLKEGELGHEDEKFSYLIASKTPLAAPSSRIIRHPMKGSGHIRFELCNQNGMLEKRVATRSQKEIYKQARDAEWGDGWL